MPHETRYSGAPFCDVPSCQFQGWNVLPVPLINPNDKPYRFCPAHRDKFRRFKKRMLKTPGDLEVYNKIVYLVFTGAPSY